MLSSLRIAVRSLSKSPGFTLVAVLTIALGIGATTAIFSAVNAVVLRPLALPEADRLAVIVETNLSRNIPFFSVSVPNYVDWTIRSSSWQSLAAVGFRAMNLTGRGEPELEHALRATASFLPTLGIPVTHGRNFTASEDRPGGPPVVILTTPFWQRHFGGRTDVIGKILTLDDIPYTIVGIAAPSSLFNANDDLIVPLAPEPSRVRRTSHDLTVYGRLKPGVTFTQADAELKAITARLWAEARDSEPGWSTRLVPLAQNEVGASVRQGLYLLLGAVGVLLLITCANLSNLLLVRASARSHETAIRVALGASRGQVIRQFFFESLAFTSAGGGVGVLFALWGVAALRAMPLPRAAEISVDVRVLAVACAASLATGLLAGLGPAVHAAQSRPQGALKGRAPLSGHRSRLRDAIVVMQMALSLTLLVGATLLARSFRRLLEVDPGFNPSQVLMVALHPRNEDDTTFYDRVVGRVAGLPQVTSVGLITLPPFSDGNTSLNVHPVGPAVISAAESIQANWRLVDGDYFRTMQIPLLRGRAFAGLAPAEAARSIVLSAGLARSLFGDGDPIGRQVNLGTGNNPITIIGIVGDVRARRLSLDPYPTFYVSVHRFTYGPMTLMVRTDGAMAPLIAAIRRAIKEIDPTVPLFKIRTMDELRAESLDQERLLLGLLGGFAVVALLLAALGTYGVIAFMAQQRTREFGLRLALGAQATDVMRLVLRAGSRLAALGSVLGLLGSLAASRLLASSLFETSPNDLVSYAVAALALVATVLLACWLPARKATRVSPLYALRSE